MERHASGALAAGAPRAGARDMRASRAPRGGSADEGQRCAIRASFLQKSRFLKGVSVYKYIRLLVTHATNTPAAVSSLYTVQYLQNMLPCTTNAVRERREVSGRGDGAGPRHEERG